MDINETSGQYLAHVAPRAEQGQGTDEQALEAWYQQQPDRKCIACKAMLPALAFGYSVMREVDGVYLPVSLHKRCRDCHAAMRDRQALPCCLCGKKTSPVGFTSYLYNFALFGGGTAIRLCCHECESAFAVLPEGQQRFYIRTCCNLASPPGQVIYGLFEPDETEALRYVGRTYHLQHRFQDHLKDRSSERVECGPDHMPYYTRANWMHDLHEHGVVPAVKELMAVGIAPTTIEWERRHIWHALRAGHRLLNHEALDEKLAQKIRDVGNIDFLTAPFSDLVALGFFCATGIEAFVHAWY